jgi:nitrogen fixation/metabolism regulation signal transduction histidine kinase
MNSLRARLILGFSLVAVLPLALALVLLEQRIQQTVAAQAAGRLEAAVEVARSGLAADGERLEARLQVLARDPDLRRLLLVPSGLELHERLDDQRFLLGLDHLSVADSAGLTVGDAAQAPRMGSAPLTSDALPAASDSGLALVPLMDGTALALEARAVIRYDGAPAGLVRGGWRLDSTYVSRLARASGLELVLRDARGRMMATTLAGEDAPAHRPDDASVGRVKLAGASWFTRETALPGGGSPAAAWLVALAPTALADDAVQVLRWTALALGGLGVLLAVMLGLVWSHQVASPVVRLAAVSERLARGEWEEPVELESMRELRTLVDALERMRLDLRAYRENLRASERQAAYGQMARRVAHEIKNPLTPIALTVSGLKRAHELGHPGFAEALDDTVRTVTEEVTRLKTLLQEFAELGRFPAPHKAPFDTGELLRDLGALHSYDVESGRLAFHRPPGVLRVNADRDQLRRALLNLVQNGLEATAPGGHVRVSAHAESDQLRVAVSDDGPGLTPEQEEQLFVPGFTTKPQGSGLGLTLVERIVTDHGGTLSVESAPGHGTTFILRLPLIPE